jgi:calcineurin-like phosphoesterase family protein
MGIYFTADLHLNHTNIIKYENRPYSTIEEMNESLIENWNRVVAKDTDEVYILGDFAISSGDKANGYLHRLRGKKYLVLGNHDSFAKDKGFDATLVEWVKDYYVLRHNKMKFVLFHYPIAVWDSQDRGAIHLYGHIHSKQHHQAVPLLKNAFNVGVDVCGYAPVGVEDIQNKAASPANYPESTTQTR